MNYEAAIQYARQRMREVIKAECDYHFEPVFIGGTEDERKDERIIIPAYNEIYILVNHQNYYGFLILSDNIIYNTDDPYNSGVPEFTGLIKIVKQDSEWSIEQKNAHDELIIVPVEFLRIVIY